MLPLITNPVRGPKLLNCATVAYRKLCALLAKIPSVILAVTK